MNKQEKTSLTLPSVGELVLFQPCSVLIPLMLPLFHWVARLSSPFQQSLQCLFPLKTHQCCCFLSRILLGIVESLNYILRRRETHQCCCFLSRILLGIVEFLNGILKSHRYYRLYGIRTVVRGPH